MGDARFLALVALVATAWQRRRRRSARPHLLVISLGMAMSTQLSAAYRRRGGEKTKSAWETPAKRELKFLPLAARKMLQPHKMEGPAAAARTIYCLLANLTVWFCGTVELS